MCMRLQDQLVLTLLFLDTPNITPRSVAGIPAPSQAEPDTSGVAVDRLESCQNTYLFPYSHADKWLLVFTKLKMDQRVRMESGSAQGLFWQTLAKEYFSAVSLEVTRD